MLVGKGVNGARRVEVCSAIVHFDFLLTLLNTFNPNQKINIYIAFPYRLDSKNFPS